MVRVTPLHEIPEKTPVLIVGGGPVGTALAVDLALRDIPCVVVERRLEISPMIKAQELSGPTMEHFKRWGIRDALITEAPRLSHQSIWFRENFVTDPLGEIEWVAPNLEEMAEAPHVAHQRIVNTVLRERAIELGVPHILGWQLTDLTQDDSGATAEITNTETNEQHSIQAQYIVGADGGNSATRRAADIPREESECLARHYNVVVELPDLLENLEAEPTLSNMVWTQDGSSMFHPADYDKGIWRYIVGPFPVDHKMTETEALEVTQRIIGKNVEVNLVSLKSFPIQKRIADSYINGRVLLAGDAAHLFPPYTGQNMNTGIGDAANLGWKLAAVLEGWGSDTLPQSYSDERYATAQRIAEASINAWRSTLQVLETLEQEDLHLGDDRDAAEREALLKRLYQLSFLEWNKNGVAMDQRYENSSIVVDDGSTVPEWDHTKYQAAAKPGHRLPHLWLGEDSLYDYLGHDFTLLVTDGSSSVIDRAHDLTSDVSIPLKIVDLTSHGVRDVFEADFVLVRPDRYVAWRGQELPDEDVFQIARGNVPASASSR